MLFSIEPIDWVVSWSNCARIKYNFYLLITLISQLKMYIIQLANSKFLLIVLPQSIIHSCFKPFTIYALFEAHGVFFYENGKISANITLVWCFEISHISQHSLHAHM